MDKMLDNTRDAPLAKRRSWQALLMIFAPAVIVTIAGFVVTYQFVKPEVPRHITMATGPKTGAYYHIGQRYQEILGRKGIELTLVETAGSDENLQLLQQAQGEVDLALLQGSAGARSEVHGVESLGSIQYEPIWLFVRGDAPDIVTNLAGKRIAIGFEGSGTCGTLQKLFEINRLDNTDTEFLNIGGTEARAALVRGQVDVAGLFLFMTITMLKPFYAPRVLA